MTHDEPTVCVAHGAFIPCRKTGEHRYTDNPYWVKSVRDYQCSDVAGLTWEPAWPATTRPIGEPHRLELPMIDRPARRVLDTECLGPCRLSRTACDARNEPCCKVCVHEGEQ